MKNNYLVRLRRPRASSPLEWVLDNAADKNEAIQIAEKWYGEQVDVILDKQAGHRFSEDHHLQKICAATHRLYAAEAEIRKC